MHINVKCTGLLTFTEKSIIVEEATFPFQFGQICYSE